MEGKKNGGVEGGKKHTKHFEENNLKINELSGKAGIHTRIDQARFSEHLSVDPETFIACWPCIRKC